MAPGDDDRSAPSDVDRPVKDRSASSDLEQHDRKVEDQEGRSELSCIARWSLKEDNIIENLFQGQRGGLSHSAMSKAQKALLLYGMSELYRGSNNPVLRIAPRDDDRPGEGKSAEFDLVQQNRSVEDQTPINSRIVLQVDVSQRITSGGSRGSDDILETDSHGFRGARSDPKMSRAPCPLLLWGMSKCYTGPNNSKALGGYT
ncbi:hypothetical protein QAD02_002250 [Eretmocerus hayati]|uniref:Uncharacterized protein n=1 Tax=Eretmocerus hayati TaxID=131215 RepID=A0ACC2NK42_9HYME|nr:hypothetical protein QAD02_002250 [Eretmocerus hayati]